MPHLHTLAIAGLLFDARNAYITEAVGVSWRSIADSGHVLLTRRLELDFERETPAGAAVKVGVRAVQRTRRTLTLQEAVWRADPPETVALGRSFQLLAALDGSGAVPLPEHLVERFELYEGGPLT